MNKKILKPILASSVVIALLSGCVNTGMPTVTNADGSTNNTQTGAIIGITWCCYWRYNCQ